MFRSLFLITILLVTFSIDVRLADDDKKNEIKKASNDDVSRGISIPNKHIPGSDKDDKQDVMLRAARPKARSKNGGSTTSRSKPSARSTILGKPAIYSDNTRPLSRNIAANKAKAAKTAAPKVRTKEDPIDALNSFKKRYDRIKNDKASKGLEGKSGKILKMVADTVHHINPVRIINNCEVEPLLKGSAINVDKLQIPVDYFADIFFVKFSKKTGWSKAELSKELKVDIVAKKPGTWFSFGNMLRAGAKKKLKLGSYLEFAGIDLAHYEKAYDDFLIETIRVPVQFIDEVTYEGFDKYIKLLVEYVKVNGGPLHSAVKLYHDHHPIPEHGANYTSTAILSRAYFKELARKRELFMKKVHAYQDHSMLQLKLVYKDWFGKGGRFFVYQDRIMKTLNSYVRFLASIHSGDMLEKFMDFIGHSVGPEGKAITYIIYQPTATMFNQVFGPLMLMQKILSSDEDLWDKILALPPIIIQTSGGRFKPILMITEPFIRAARFILTGQFTKSLSSGLDISAAFGISIWGGAYKPKKLIPHKSSSEIIKEVAARHTTATHKPAGHSKAPAARSIARGHYINHKDDRMLKFSEPNRPQDNSNEQLKPDDNNFKDQNPYKPKGSDNPGHSGLVRFAQKSRRKRDTKKSKKAKPEKHEKHDKVMARNPSKPVSPEDASVYTKSDIKMADAYQGGPPLGGYKLGVKNDGKLDLDDEDLISRILLIPDFILKAGGPVFVPFASVVAPCLRVANLVLFGKDDFGKRIAEVPDIIRGVGIVGPLAELAECLIPFIKTAYLANTGKLTNSDIVIQTPNLVKQLSNGKLFSIYKHPDRLVKEMLAFLPGNGGLLAMLKLQATGQVPSTDPGAAEDTIKQLGAEADFVHRSLGQFFGGWALGYIQALGPIGSMYGALFNGIIGNIIDAVRFVDQKVNLRMQPLKNMIEAFDNLALMFKSADNRNSFLTAVLGGHDPDVFLQVGIDIGKLVEHNIDAGMLLAGGKHFLTPEAQAKLASGADMGIDAKKLSKIGLTDKKLFESGLLDAEEEVLYKNGIEYTAFLNRAMRGSVEDHMHLMSAGISVKIMLKNGVEPAIFLAGGARAIPKTKTGKSFGNDLSDEDLRFLGLNPAKLQAKGVNAKKLATDGVLQFEKTETNIGLHVKHLMISVYCGLEPEKLSKAGVDIHMMLINGFDPKLILTGGLKKALKNDVSEKSLAKTGINLKKIVEMGINIHLLTDVGAAILNPMNMIKMGVDPMRVLIGTLSRHGLDSMTGGLDNAGNIAVGFINSILKIVSNCAKLLPKIRDLPFGKNIVGPDGRWTGIPAFFFYKILGIDGHNSLLGFLQKLFSGQFSTAEIMALLNPIRIADEMAHPHRKPLFQKKSKPNRQAVDEYVMKSANLRFAFKNDDSVASRSAAHKANKSGKDEATDESNSPKKPKQRSRPNKYPNMLHG